MRGYTRLRGHKAGVILADLVAAELRPRPLFEVEPERRERLMSALDAVNHRYGKFTAVTAAQRFERGWRLRAENRSPAWTTRIAEVQTVRA